MQFLGFKVTLPPWLAPFTFSPPLFFHLSCPILELLLTCKADNTPNTKKLECQKKQLYLRSSLQCRRFLLARNLLTKAPCWKFPKRGGDGASQRERGGGREREEKMPSRKHCENEKHPLIRREWPLFQKWVADKTKQSLQSKDSHCLNKNKLEFIIVFILTDSQCNSPQLMKL